MSNLSNYIKWGFESRLKPVKANSKLICNYIKWGFESRLKLKKPDDFLEIDYIKWGFESRLKPCVRGEQTNTIISNGDLRVD